MEAVAFTVPGIPVAKARSRFKRAGFVDKEGNRRFSYPDAKTVAAERGIAAFAQEAMAGRPLIDRPCELRIVAVFLAPKRTKAACARPDADFKGTRADLDNYIKSCMDACNGVVWRDDALVASIRAAKVFGPTPGLRISVEPLSQTSWPLQEAA